MQIRILHHPTGHINKCIEFCAVLGIFPVFRPKTFARCVRRPVSRVFIGRIRLPIPRRGVLPWSVDIRFCRTLTRLPGLCCDAVILSRRHDGVQRCRVCSQNGRRLPLVALHAPSVEDCLAFTLYIQSHDDLASGSGLRGSTSNELAHRYRGTVGRLGRREVCIYRLVIGIVHSVVLRRLCVHVCTGMRLR